MGSEFDEIISQLALTQPLIVSSAETDYINSIDEISRRMGISKSDLEIFDAAGPIEELRSIMSRFLVKPHSSALRLFVIINCENIGVASSNTLLKLLEEPPKYLRIALFTSSYTKILPTIKSRCKRVILVKNKALVPGENFYEFFKAGSFVDFSKHIAKLENDELAERVKNTLEVMRQNGLNEGEGYLFKKLSDAYIKLSSQNINGKLKLEGIFIEYLVEDA